MHTRATRRTTAPLGTVRRIFGHLQVVSAALMAFSHGSNDGQKFIGVKAIAEHRAGRSSSRRCRRSTTGADESPPLAAGHRLRSRAGPGTAAKAHRRTAVLTLCRSYRKYGIMEIRITATELARKLGDVLGKIRYRSDSFVVERNGEEIARISPAAGRVAGSLAEGLRAWREAAPADPRFAKDLERVNRSDRPPRNPWAS